MALRTIEMTQALYDYMLKVSLRDSELKARLREETLAKTPQPEMQISPEQGQFMGLVARMIGARNALEVGTFTGYSALSVAEALPADGRLVACDISVEFTDIARRYWAEAGVADRIELHIGPAVETLDRLLDDGAAGTFDMAFIDADKPGYDAYYERVLRLLRAGGVLLLDNMFMGGSVIDPEKQEDANARAIRALNEKLATDERVTISLLPVGDGVTLALKR